VVLGADNSGFRLLFTSVLYVVQPCSGRSVRLRWLLVVKFIYHTYPLAVAMSATRSSFLGIDGWRMSSWSICIHMRCWMLSLLKV
jgi:hypothetical protein